MKKLHLFKTVLLLCALIVGSGTMWADDVTGTLTLSSDKKFGTTSGSTLTDDKSNTWTCVGTSIQNAYNSSYAGQQFGTKYTDYSYTFTADFTGKTVTGVSIKAAAGSSTPTYNISVGGSSKKSGSLSTTSTTYSTGAISGTGNVVITLNQNGGKKAVYLGQIVVTYTSKTAAGLTFGTHEGETYTVLPVASFVAPTLSNPNSLTVSYETSDADIAAVNSAGAITIGTKEGTATITASSEENATYAAGSASYKIQVQKGTTTVTLSSAALTFNILDGTTQTLTGTPKYNDAAIDGAAVTWSVVSGSDYASVSDAGVVSAIAPGSATIRASYAGSDVYAASTADCVVTVNKANTTLTLDESEGEIDLKNVGSRTFTLTPTVFATKTIGTAVVVSPTITWTSSDTDVATVTDGVITGKKVGPATITASYAGGTNYNAADNATFSLTVSDTRTAVNMETFTADKTTLVIGDKQATTVTNDRDGWTAAYTYTSSDETVATVASDGKITAVAKGTATITATLKVADNDENYKAGSTTSKTIEITVTKPFHTVTFSVNGNTDLTASVEEEQPITFPTAVETTPGDNQFPKVINGMTFVGWFTNTYINASVAPSYVNTASTNMGDDDVTYYAVYADKIEEESDDMKDAVIGQTLQYDTWTYSGTTTDMDTYRLFAENAYIESASLDLSKVMKVLVYAGTYGTVTPAKKKVTVMAGDTEYGTATLSTNKENTLNTITSDAVLSGNGKVKIIAGGGNGTSTGIRIKKVEIYVKGTIVSYENYNTTVSDLPRPEITMADVEMTWGDTDKYVVPSATVGEDAYEGSFTYDSDNVNLTVASDGKLTCNVPGTYHVTASIAATGEHQAAEKTCTVTVNKQNITVTFAKEEDMVMVSAGSYTQAASVAPVAYDGEITYSITSSTSTGATIDDGTGELSFENTGVIVVTATASATSLYNGNTASYTLKVKTTPTITVSNQSKKIGETYEPTITGGNVTITCTPANMVTVDGNVITAAAVGTTTVTVATAANDTYIAGEESFTMTITDDTEGLEELPEADPVAVFEETFAGCKGTGGNDDTWSSFAIADNGAPTFDIEGWSKYSAYAGSNCLAVAKSGSATTPQLHLDGEITYILSFRAGCWNTKDETANFTLSINGDAKLDDNSSQTVDIVKSEFNTYSYSITGGASTTTIKFQATSTGRFFLDDVKITRPGDPIESIDATIYNNGKDKNFATVCSQYPLDLDKLPSGVKAYKVSEVSGTNVTFSRLTGTIKGGVPFILYGAPNDYELPTAESSDVVPTSNLLIGTLAPTYVASDEDYYCFGISKTLGKFVKVKGVMPAGKAYLKVTKATVDTALANALNIIFEDEETTAISEVRGLKSDVRGEFFNLNGQRVATPVKGNIYIVNGKKVMFK